MRGRGGLLLGLCAIGTGLAGLAAAHSLIVVKDLGGASALPYYRALNLLPDWSGEGSLSLNSPPSVPRARLGDADFLPVHSARLTPGRVHRRVIAVPGLTPICLVGADPKSRAWLKARLDTLEALHAVGLVVEVASYADLEALRRLAPGIPLVPASGDDIARRLALHHYPVLITSTGIEQ